MIYTNSWPAIFFRITAIDIIIQGLPCANYSAANAKNKGIQGEQGSYMLKFGEFINLVRVPQGCPFFFLAENSVL